MNSSIKDRNVLATLVQQYHELAYEIECCIRNISELWNKEIKILDELTAIKDKLANSKRSLNTLTVRMPIVAPIKAGKSTIVSALVGEDLLPSRNEAMTILPTEVRLISESVETHLKLTDHCVETIERYYDVVKTRVQEKDDEYLSKLFPQDARLISIAREVIGFQGVPLKKTIVGADRIREMLQFFNDLIRIFINLSEHGVSSGCYEHFRDNIPIIEVTYKCPKELDQVEEHVLTIVDTPGPNESSKRESSLYEIMRDELRNADLVLVALDYTKIGSTEDAKIAGDVAKIQNILQGNTVNNVYAVVNKVDQRRRGDRSPAEVRAHLKQTYNIVESNVFELKAAHALAAKKYMNYFNNLNNKESEKDTVRGNQFAEDLLRELYHDDCDYEEHLNMRREELYKKSEKIYKNSGMELFLYESINSIVANIRQRCMKTCVDTCCMSAQIFLMQINRIYDPLQSSVSQLEKDISAQQYEIKELEANSQVQTKRKELVMRDVKKQIEQVLDIAEQETEKAIAKLFDESNDVWQQPKNWISQLCESAHGRRAGTAAVVAGTVIGDVVAVCGADIMMSTATLALGLPSAPIIGGAAAVVAGVALLVKAVQFADQMDHVNDRKEQMKFTSNEEVKKFFENVSGAAAEVFNMIFVSLCKKVDDICENTITKYKREVQDGAMALLDKVKQKAKQSYQVEAIKLVPLNIEQNKKFEISTPVVKRYRPIWALGVFELETKSDAAWNMTYNVSCNDTKKHVSNVIHSRRKQMSDKISAYINAELNARLEKDFFGFINYLKDAQREFEDILEMKKRNADKTKEVKKLLENSLVKIKQLETHLKPFYSDKMLI